MKNILENKFWFAARSFAAVLIFGATVATSQSIEGDHSGQLQSFQNLECAGEPFVDYDMEATITEDSIHVVTSGVWTFESLCGLFGAEIDSDGLCLGMDESTVLSMYCPMFEGTINGNICEVQDEVDDAYTFEDGQICMGFSEGEEPDCGPVTFTEEGFHWNFTFPSEDDDGTGSCTLFSFGGQNTEPEVPQLFISEYGEGSGNNKYIEIYNGTGQDVDLSGYAIWKIANGGDWAEGQGNNADLSGTLAAGDVFILCNSSSDAAILAEADITGTQASNFNGDDAVGLAYNGVIIDAVGTEGSDPGSGWHVAGISNATANHTLVRKASVTNGNTDWVTSAGTDEVSSEWIVLGQDTWTNLGSHVMNNEPEEPAIVGRWLLAPSAGALSYGPADGSAVWWASSAEDVDSRECLFDDVYVFEADGTFKNELEDATWVEGWQGVEEGCAAPIAPHNGQNPGAWSYTSSSEDTIRIEGVGSFLGIAKATNGLELSSPEGAPDSVEYQIVSLVEDSAMVVSVNVGGGVWTFSFVSENLETHSDVTFAVDMSFEEVDPTGVYIAGGAIFANAGLAMEDNGNGIWTVTASLPIGERVYYKFRNRASTDGGDWGGFEPQDGLIDGGCADGQYNDRFIDVGSEDIVLDPVCYGACVDCASYNTIDITFQVGMPYDVVISEQGVFVAGGSAFGSYNDNQMEHVGDNVYRTTITVPANSGSHYTYVNGDWWDHKENIAAQGCSDPFNYSDRFLEWGEEDITVSNCFGYCGDGDGLCWDLPEPSFVAVDFGVDMSEFSWESGVPADTVWVTGTFDGWSGKGYPLFDYEENGVYRTTVDFHLNGGHVEYKYTVDGWGSPESGAALGEDCDFYQENDDNSNNYGFYIEDYDIELPIFVFGQGCEVREENDDWVCEITNCENLHFVGAFPVHLFTEELEMPLDSIASYIEMGYLGMGVNGMWPGGDSTHAIFLPQVSSVEDSAFIFLAEYPFGVPVEEGVSYEWFFSMPNNIDDDGTILDYDIYGEGAVLFSSGWSSDCAHPYVNSEGDSIAMRYWDPEDYVVELAEIEAGFEEPTALWEFNYWGTCDNPFDGDEYGEESDEIDFYTHYDLETESTTTGDGCDTHDGGTYIYDMVWKLDEGTGNVYLTTPDCPTINSHWKAFELNWDDVSYETQEGGMMWCNSQDSAGECQPGAWSENVVYLVMTEEQNTFKVELEDYNLDDNWVAFRYEQLFPEEEPNNCADGEVEVWDECYDIATTTSISLYEQEGEIPYEISQLVNLESLRIRYGNLTGPIPMWIMGLGNLNELRLDHNNLSGHVPPELFEMPNLTSVRLDNNDLTGNIPATLVTSNIQFLKIDDNNLTGVLPEGLCGMQNVPEGGQIDIILYGNYFCKPYPSCDSGVSLNIGQQNFSECDNVNYQGIAYFEDVADMNIARYGFGYTTDGMYAYAASGEAWFSSGDDEPIWAQTGEVERYNPYTNNWEIFADGLLPRVYTDAQYVDGYVYVFGGRTYIEETDSDTIFATVQAIDSLGQVSDVSMMPHPVTYAGSVVWNDTVYVWGGSDRSGDASNKLFRYVPHNNTWAELAPMPVAYGSVEGVAVDGVIYSFGGYTGEANSTIYAYDIYTDTWSAIADAPYPSSSHAVAYDHWNHKIIVTGDYHNIEYVSSFDPETYETKVLQADNMAGRRHSGSVFMDNGGLYIFGGLQYEGYNGHEDYVGLGSTQRADLVYHGEETMVTFWLDAEDVPCGGNPWVSGTFNEWNPEGDTMYEMTYDPYWNEFSVDLLLEPGYYEYKFHCYDNGIDWTDEETVPAECGVPNSPDAVEYHRFINVPELYSDDWYEVPVVAWGDCPDPDPCELVDCNNLAMVHVVEDSLISAWADYLIFAGFMSDIDSAYAFIMDGNMQMSVHNFLDNNEVEIYPAQVVDSDEDFLIYLAEIPGGFPDSLFSYYWTYHYEEEGQSIWQGEYFEGECTNYNDAFGMETRYWDPADWEEEFYLLSVGDEDVEITDIWNFDNWNGCDWYDYDDDSDDYVTFTKENFADPNLEENQDRITDEVWITRGDQGWLYNAAIENSHSGSSPALTMWAMGTTESQSFYNYSSLKDVVDSEIGGFNYIAGMTMSMYLMDTDEFFDVVFHSWTNGNNGGGFSYSRIAVDAPSMEEPVLTNYSIDVINVNSLFAGDTVGTLPMLDIYDGLFFRAVFDMSAPGPYMGLATVYFDSNFNGVLDMDDQNILNENWNNDGNEVVPILDNGPLDQNPEVGIYEQFALAQDPGNENLLVQGATYFYVALDTSNTITSVQPVTPYSESTQRISGHASMAHDSTEVVPGLMFTVYDYDDGELRHGITNLDGYYNIGVNINENTYANIFSSNEGFGSNPRLRPLFYYDSEYYDDSGSWSSSYYYYNVPPEGVYIPVSVLEYNTMVHGHMFDPMGEIIADQWLEYSNVISIGDASFNDWSYTSTDSNGYYEYWGINGAESDINFYTDEFGDYDTTIYVFSDQYDDELGAYLFNHDIQLLPPPPGPPVNLINNGGFETEGMMSWNVYPVEASNWAVDSTGAGIYTSPNNATLEAYDGHYSLKMWGGYHSYGFNWTDIYQSHVDYVDEGGVIHASAKMMSHPDDWIGTLDSSAHLGTNKAYLFISYWDENGYMIDSDYSNPFDGTFDAGQWHHIEVTGTVPNGTHHVNIGLSYNQNDWSNGSVYIDEVESHVGLNFVASGVIEGHIMGEMYDEDMQYWYMADFANVPVEVYSENNYYVVYTDDVGNYNLEVPAGDFYYVSVPDMPGMYTYDYHHIYVEEYNTYGADISYYAIVNQRFELSGSVVDADGNPIVGAQVQITGVSDTNYWHSVYTNENGDFFEEVAYGVYDLRFYFYGHLNVYTYDVEVYDHTNVGQIEMQFISEFDGSVQGVITYVGQEEPDMPAYMYITNDYYQVYVNVDENGFFYADLIDGIYNVYANAPGYSSIWLHNAFEISGNNVVFDFNLYEEGYAGPPEIVDLHDIPNDQGRQMRTVWQSGMAGEWEYFTQFSIWRKVNGAPIDLWDYVETIPWHGESDPYAAVVPTLGDSSMHETHMSTFIVTAHTEDVNYYIDSEPVSGYSVDNLHPGTPMNFMMSQDPGSVSLSWIRDDDEDFDYHNIYRREIASDEPAMVFTTVDSFYVDQDVSESGAYEYWITSVDMSGLESDPSNSVSAVLSADETIGLPTEFALNQNYPNPFNPSTQIQYALPEEAMVTISIYDLMGRKIRTLVNGVQNAGYRTVMWNATNDMGRLVSAGVYIYSIQAGDFVQNRKMVLMK